MEASALELARALLQDREKGVLRADGTIDED